MPQMVFIRSINPNTFLHLSTKGESFCLCDYSTSPTAPPVEVMRQMPEDGVNTSAIEAEARRAGNILLQAPSGADKDQHAFWYRHVLELNRKHLRSAPEPEPPPRPAPDFTVGITTEIRRGGILLGVLRTGRSGLVWLPRGQLSGHRLTWDELERLVAQHGTPVGVAE